MTGLVGGWDRASRRSLPLDGGPGTRSNWQLGADVSQRPAAPAGACATAAADQQELPVHYLTTWSLVGSLRF
jgi:hypothetical protein